MINVLDNVDSLPANVQFSHQEALWYVFEDRSSGQDDLDWLFDQINLDPKIQIKYMLTKGNFTRDEWNHLLCKNNCHFSHADGSAVMSKRTQKNQVKKDVKVRVPGVRKLRTMTERRHPLFAFKEEQGTTIQHWRRRNRIGFVAGIPIILGQVNGPHDLTRAIAASVIFFPVHGRRGTCLARS